MLQHAACFNTADADPVNLLASIESVLKHSQEPDDAKHLIRQQVTSLLLAHKPRVAVPKAEQDALERLKADRSIVVLPADKGRSTVVLDKSDYLRKANALLDDRLAYLRCDGDPIKKLVAQINTTLARLQSNGAISKAERLAIKPTDSAMARFYGLPKVHKPDAPLRPIVSLRGTPTFNLAKWLFRRLNCLTSGSDTTVRSAVHFLERLQALHLNADEVMVSFDFTSLFTSIPQSLAIETVGDLLESQYDDETNRLNRGHLIQMLNFCLKTYFTFEGTIYEQVKGTPMGSPLSGFIAEAVFQKLETLVFATHRPIFWARYVDDTVVILKREMISGFHTILNSVFPDIQFTREAEVNNQLAFLDVLVDRKTNGNLRTTDKDILKDFLKRLQTNPETREGLAQNRPAQPSTKQMGSRHQSQKGDAQVTSASTPQCQPPAASNMPALLTHTSRTNWYRRPPSDAMNQHTVNVNFSEDEDAITGTRNLLAWRFGFSLESEHAAAVRRGDASSQVAAHSTGPGHIFKYQEAEILARGDNRVSRELLELWFSGPQSINKHNDLPVPYSVLRFSLGRGISHVGRARASNYLGDNELICRAIITPASSTNDEIPAINDSDSD
ncbi:hypothetical protein SprV_0501834200 [Sparganum proliferum]